MTAAHGACSDPRMPEPIQQFFTYAHLPPHLQAVSKPFGDLAALIEATVPRNAERTVALRKILEAKDAAVRAVLFRDPCPRCGHPLDTTGGGCSRHAEGCQGGRGG